MDDEEDPCLEILTKREKQILKLVASGLANKNISVKLKISVRTVETHRANLSNKLGIKTTAGLVKYAISKGML
jgi:two-component system, NarL family, nitrate/nitrite response regulator NarL